MFDYNTSYLNNYMLMGAPNYNFGNFGNSSFDYMSPPMVDYTSLFQMLYMQQFFNTPTANVQKSNLKLDGSFESALNVTLKFEGGYSNDKDDRGGATNFGITQSTYNSWCKRNGQAPKDVRNITKDEVKEIYYKDYWLASGADKIKDPKMALLMFDTSVLHGVSGAKKIYKQSGGDYNKFLQARRDRYEEIVGSDPSQKKFYAGWMNRVNKLNAIC